MVCYEGLCKKECVSSDEECPTKELCIKGHCHNKCMRGKGSNVMLLHSLIEFHYAYNIQYANLVGWLDMCYSSEATKISIMFVISCMSS